MAGTRSWTCVVTCCLLATIALSSSTTTPAVQTSNMTYIVTFARRIFYGQPLVVSVYVADATGPFTLTLDLLNKYGQSLRNQEFNMSATDDVQTVQFEILKEDEKGNTYPLHIRARASGGKTFDVYGGVYFYRGGRKIYTTTDKKTYAYGDTVRYRMVAIPDNLVVENIPISIAIKDRFSYYAGKWDNMRSEDGTGVVQGEMLISSMARSGEWKITSSVRHVTSIHHFYVRYPKAFEVELAMPDAFKLTTPTVSGTVTARYADGKPVQGIVHAKVYFYWDRDNPNRRLHKDFALDKYGKAEVTFLTKDILTLDLPAPRLKAEVTDELSGNVEYAEKSFRMGTGYRGGTSYSSKSFQCVPSPYTPDQPSIFCTAQKLMTSPTDTQLRLEPHVTTAPKVGEKAVFALVSTKVFSSFTIQVFARKTLAFTERRTLSKPSKRARFKLTITPEMTPVAQVVAFFVTESGEIVANRVVMIVKDLGRKVSLSFQNERTRAGKSVNLTVSGQPGTRVFLQGAEQRSREDTTTIDKLIKQQLSYGYRLEGGQLHTYFDDDNASDMFYRVGVRFITDGIVPGSDGKKQFQKPDFATMPPTTTTTTKPRSRPATKSQTSVSNSTSSVPDSHTKGASQALIRVPEKNSLPHLWVNMTLRHGTETVELKTPESPNDWWVHGIGFHPQHGLALIEKPAELKTSKKLFLLINYPKTAHLGEDVCVSVIALNHYAEKVKASISLAQNASGFDSVLVQRGGSNSSDADVVYESVDVVRKLGALKAGGSARATFCVRPKCVGDVPLHLVLDGTKPGDTAQPVINVVHEGVPRVKNYPVLVETEAGEEFSTTVNIQLPKECVKGTLEVTFQAVGDIMAGVAANVESVLNMPKFSLEPRVANFAFSSHLLAYLKNTHQLTPATEARAKSFMREVLQGLSINVYSYRWSRDRYFRTVDKSLWSPAFALKTLSQAERLRLGEGVTYNLDHIESTVRYLLKYQTKKGNFNDPGQSGHPAFTGGDADVVLTAHIVIALHEAQTFLGSSGSLRKRFDLSNAAKATSMATKYLGRELTSIRGNPYAVCVVSYALALTAGNKKAKEAKKMMEQLAITKDDMKYWSNPKQSEKKKNYYWHRETDPLSIEMTSYALLTLMLDGSQSEAIPVFRWLSRQRGPNGGFIITSDTAVGLEALSKMTELALGNSFSPIEIEVSSRYGDGASNTTTLTISKDTALTPQTLSLPLKNGEYPRRVVVTARSASKKRLFAMAQVVVRFNTNTNTRSRSLKASVKVQQENETLTLITCVRRTTNDSNTSLVILQIGVPTDYGFGTKYRSFYGLGTEPECVTWELRRSQIVVGTRPVPVRVYDFYNPDDEVTFSIKPETLCERRPDYMDCSPVD